MDTETKQILIAVMSLFFMMALILTVCCAPPSFSLPDIATEGQENMKITYNEIQKHIINHEHSIHVMDGPPDNHHIPEIKQIEDYASITDIHVIKKDKAENKDLVKLTELVPLKKEYAAQIQYALMSSNDVDIYKNIYHDINANICTDIHYDTCQWRKHNIPGHKIDHEDEDIKEIQKMVNIK